MIDEIATDNPPVYNFLEPVNLDCDSANEPLFQAIVSTKAFQRLKLIRFLGGIDYLAVRVPNGTKARYTRYQHSLGVAHLALLYADHVKLNPADRQLAYSAALLHDIGHAPLSHSLEPVFQEHFGIDHHNATKRIIFGATPLGTDIREALTRHNIDLDQLVATIDGKEDRFNGFFSGPINFDTIEGILRTQTYAKPKSLIPSPKAVLMSAIANNSAEDRRIVDEFWMYKDEVYRTIINSQFGLLADYACRMHMTQNLSKFSCDDYYINEKQFFRKLPELRSLLIDKSFSRLIRTKLKEPLHYRLRHFYIDKTADFFAGEYNSRYKQTKKDCFFYTDYIEPQPNEAIGQDLFDVNNSL